MKRPPRARLKGNTRRRLLCAGAVLALAGAAGPSAAAAAPAHVPGEVVVALEGGALPVRVLLADGQDPVAVAAALEREAGVTWAEPNHLFQAAAVPNDPFFGTQWGLQNTGQRVNGRTGVAGADIRAAAAWDRTVGDPGVVIAVVDGGVDPGHPDLAPNLALNAGEIGDGREANRIDDDGNGLVDDVRGWDFADGDADPTETDPDSHGSHVTGTAAAAGGNGVGVTGVAQRASVVPVRALDAAGSGSGSDIAAGFRYAALRGARIVNASLGGGGASNTIEAAIRDSPNTLFVVASGNEGDDVDFGSGSYPCQSPAPNVICVTATDQSDQLPSFANVGRISVDIGAPGVNVLSTVAGAGYEFKTGTSMATPHVSGAAALALAASPGLSTVQLREALLAGARRVPALDGRTTSGGRLDAAGTLAALPPPATGPPALTQPAQGVTGTSARLLGITRRAGQPAVHYFEYGTTTAYGRRTPQRPTGSAEALGETVTGLTPGTTYHARLVTATVSGVSFGPDVTFTTPSPATSPAPAPTPVAPAPAAVEPTGAGAGTGAGAAAPLLTVRRVGRSWLATLTLANDAVVSGRLERRTGRGARPLTVRGFRRRGLGAGAQAFALGRLEPGRYRVSFTTARGEERATVERSFRVAAPVASGLSVRRRGGGYVARVSVSARARAGGLVLRLDGAGPDLVARIRPRVLRPGAARVVPLAMLSPGRYRLVLTVRAGSRRRVLVERFTVGPPGRDGAGIVFRSRWEKG